MPLSNRNILLACQWDGLEWLMRGRSETVTMSTDTLNRLLDHARDEGARPFRKAGIREMAALSQEAAREGET